MRLEPVCLNRQRGISLMMSLIMLVVLTMIAVSATYSTNSTIRVMGNMQMQDEALVAVQDAIDEKISNLASFTAPNPNSHQVDINRDGNVDYTVQVSKPQCVSKRPMPGYSVTVSASSPNMTYWEYDATVTDNTTGASVRARQGVKIILLPSQGCS